MKQSLLELMKCFETYQGLTFERFVRLYGRSEIDKILDIIEEACPRFRILVSEDIDFNKNRFIFMTADAVPQIIAGRVDIDYDTLIEEVVYKLITFCDNPTYQHTLPKHTSSETIVNPAEPHYCTSCGAPLKKNNHKCDYCGTEYW